MHVLVVDDSPYHRLRLVEAVREIPRVSRVTTASSGAEAIRLAVASRLDLILLDIEMPAMDGLAVLRWLMAERPVPVLVVTDTRHEGIALRALELGAFDVLRKPPARALAPWRARVAEAIEEASQLRLEPLARRAREERARPAAPPCEPAKKLSESGLVPRTASGRAVVVASSTGGPPALRDLFASLPPGDFIVAVAQHMPAAFTKKLAAHLSSVTAWESREPVDGECARPGVLWIAPGGHHLAFAEGPLGPSFSVRPNRHEHPWCPSADALFASAAGTFGHGALAVVLTGMGSDASEGAREIHRQGGLVVCESRETAVIAGMPDAAARLVPAALRAPLPRLADEIASLLPRLGRPQNVT